VIFRHAPPGWESSVAALSLPQPTVDRLRDRGIDTIRQLYRANLSAFNTFEQHQIRRALDAFTTSPTEPPRAA